MLRYISVITCSFGFAIAAQANMITNGSFELPPITIGIYPQLVFPVSGTLSDFIDTTGGLYIWFESTEYTYTDEYTYTESPRRTEFPRYPELTCTQGDNCTFLPALPYPHVTTESWTFDANTGGNWVSHTLLLNLTPDTYTLSFAPLGSFRDPLLDKINVTISTMNVPEPATFTLISLGLAGMAFGKRRKLT